MHATSIETQRTSKLASFITSGFGLLAALLASATFFTNIAVVAILRNRLADSGIDDIRADWGNAVRSKTSFFLVPFLITPFAIRSG